MFGSLQKIKNPQHSLTVSFAEKEGLFALLMIPKGDPIQSWKPSHAAHVWFFISFLFAQVNLAHFRK